MEEAPGILAWAIKGCLEWQRIGLQPPAAVTSATDDYLADQDIFGAWFTTACEFSKSYECPGGDLYQSYSSFCKDRDVEVSIGPNKFPGRLLERGFGKKKTKNNNSYVGIRLRSLPATVAAAPPTHTNDSSPNTSVSTFGGGGGTTSIIGLTRACRDILDLPPPPPPDEMPSAPTYAMADNATQGQAVAGNGHAASGETVDAERTADGRLVARL